MLTKRFLISIIILSQLGFNIVLLRKCKIKNELNADVKMDAQAALDYILNVNEEKMFSYSKNRIYDSSEHLIIKQLNNNKHWHIFLKENYLVENITTWHGFHQKVMAYFHKVEPDLEKEWGLKGKVLQAAFFTGIAKHLFPFGTKSSIGGCASKYYKERHKSGGWVPLSFFLYKAPNGCCNDYATFLYMLLKLSGIDAKHIQTTKDHVFIEAIINGQPYTLDPSLSFFSPHAVKELFKRRKYRDQEATKEDIRVIYTLPTADCDPTSEFYRERRGRRNIFGLLTVGSLNVSPKYISKIDIVEKMLEHNGIGGY